MRKMENHGEDIQAFCLIGQNIRFFGGKKGIDKVFDLCYHLENCVFGSVGIRFDTDGESGSQVRILRGRATVRRVSPLSQEPAKYDPA